MGIVFALLCAFCIAGYQIITKRAYDHYPPSVAFIIDVLFCLLIWLPFGLISGVNLSLLPITFIYALLSAILAEALFFWILSKGELSITSTILATFAIYTGIFSFFINHERVTHTQLIFILLTIIGTIIVSLPEKIKKSEFKKKAFIIWALVGAIAIGFSDTLTKGIIDRASIGTFLFAIAIIQIPVGLIYLRLEKQSPKVIFKIIGNSKKYWATITGSFLNVIGTLFLFLAFKNTLASLASPIVASSPVIVVLLAVYFLKEKVTLKDKIGLLVTIIGIIGISL